eukprot:SAG31_NODE_1999_length_6695_cov_2.926774_1_plen_74_part_00
MHGRGPGPVQSRPGRPGGERAMRCYDRDLINDMAMPTAYMYMYGVVRRSCLEAAYTAIQLYCLLPGRAIDRIP